MPGVYKKLAGKSTYIDGGIITLRNGREKFVNTSIHGWHDFQKGYLTNGCIRVPYQAIETLLERVEEGTQVKIYQNSSKMSCEFIRIFIKLKNLDVETCKTSYL
ncbi:MAG: L,D-transpeptidase [Candidatus Pacearchaeota archaeon]|nr:L,D-transpeptidase [Candidatus Pacearchaeota archaeon]